MEVVCIGGSRDGDVIIVVPGATIFEVAKPHNLADPTILDGPLSQPNIHFEKETYHVSWLKNRRGRTLPIAVVAGMRIRIIERIRPKWQLCRVQFLKR